MALPSSGKPTASDVVEWCLALAKKRKGVNVDGAYGMQCWDLPNYILKRYWGFTTWGNANAMAQKSNYRGYPFKIYRYTPSFLPKPGDFAVYAGSNPGHVNIVVGPVSKTNFTAVDQNWYNANAYYGSPAAKVNHNYNGVTHFVRPPYKEEPQKPEEPTKPVDPKPPVEKPTKEPEKPAVRFKEIKKIKYSVVDIDMDEELDIFTHYLSTDSKRRSGKIKGVTIKNANTMRNVEQLYQDKDELKYDKNLPHFFVDRNSVWHCKENFNVVESDLNNIVIEICEDLTVIDDTFKFNEIVALMVAVDVCKNENITFNDTNIKANKEIWRSLKIHANWDMLKSGYPSSEKYKKLEKALISLYMNREKVFNEKPKDVVEKFKIKIAETNKNKDVEQVKEEPNKDSPSKQSKTKITTERSKYTKSQALNKQMSVGPKVSNGVAWYNASVTQTRNAMNVNTIWNSKTQVYQMLDLGKYQGIPVSKLNILLEGKGKLSGQGKAFAEAGKRYRVNEIYLIAHAILETGNGRSYFASGNSGYYNMYGIGAYDSNPNYAITFAKNQGWNTAAKAIIGGARFIRKDFINVSQNTLYRMRWNPKKPGIHQYATDIRWCQHQATTIKQYYTKIGLKGQYFIRDKYNDS